MNTKKFAILLCATYLAGALSLAIAQTPAPAPAAPSASVVVMPSVVSQYMFRGVRLGGPSLQTSIEYDSGPAALGVWSSLPLKDRVPGQSNPEIDPYGSYKFDVIKDTLTVQPGFTAYTYVKAHTNNGFYKFTFEPNLAVNYTVGALTLTPKLYYDLVLKGPTAELNAAYTIPLKDLGTELDFAGSLGTYEWGKAAAKTSPDVKNWGNYWQAGVSLPFQIVKDTQKLTIGFSYTRGTGNILKQGAYPQSVNSAAVGRGVGMICYAITF
jgi:uncharacterized protein (TIGR02001 family)